jgi:5-methylthioadenosine/S-adenosylhomocysteine deaminase
MIVLKPDAVLLGSEVIAGRSIHIEDDAIVAIEPSSKVPSNGKQPEIIELPGQLVMPGLINAHQHGKGLSTLQLGFPDEPLEAWLARKRLRAPMNPHLMTLLATVRMIASGVTSTIQANTPYGTGDYRAEIRGSASAYNKAGIRAIVGLGAMDRAEIVYPATAQPAFVQGLPDHLRALFSRPRFEVYAGDADATASMFAECQETLASPLVSFCYAPAGPQWVSDGLMGALADASREANVPLHMHGLESLSQANALREAYPEGFLKHLSKLGAVSDRLAVAHAVWLTPEDIEIASAADVVLVRNPGSNLRLHAGIAPIAYYLDRGVTVAIGSDNTTLSDDEDLFSELRLAARLAYSPYWDGPPSPSSSQLLAMITENGAAAMMQRGKIGRVSPGYKADLIGISLDRICGAYWDDDLPLLDALFARAHRTDVTFTMVNGEMLYRNGSFLKLSPEQIARDAAENARMTRHPPGVNIEQVEELITHVTEFYRKRHQRLTTGPWSPVAENVGWS